MRCGSIVGMPTDTRQLLAELRDDHRNMGQVLDVLQKAVNSARAGNDPDMELIDEIMRYMTVYPDAVHHPKEDVVYAELKRRRPDLADNLDDVPADHREIAALGSKLRDEVEAIIAGAAVRRDRFIDDASRYATRLRNHMQWEEDDLFRRVDDMLRDSPASLDVDAWQRIRDPVFDLEVQSAFRRLSDVLDDD